MIQITFTETGMKLHHLKRGFILAYETQVVGFRTVLLQSLQDGRLVLLNRPIERKELSATERVLVFYKRKDLLRFAAHVHKAEPDLDIVVVRVLLPTNQLMLAKFTPDKLRPSIIGGFTSIAIPFKILDTDVKKGIAYKEEMRQL